MKIAIGFGKRLLVNASGAIYRHLQPSKAVYDRPSILQDWSYSC